VVFFDQKLSCNVKYLRKQGMQLASKMRFIAAQLDALLTDDLWLANARHSNRMAKLLQRDVSRIPNVKIVYKVEANGVFAKIPRSAISRLRKRYFFYVVDEERSVVRWMCSFDTTKDDIVRFAECLSEVLGNK
jgi:threonine aldolase